MEPETELWIMLVPKPDTIPWMEEVEGFIETFAYSAD